MSKPTVLFFFILFDQQKEQKTNDTQHIYWNYYTIKAMRKALYLIDLIHGQWRQSFTLKLLKKNLLSSTFKDSFYVVNLGKSLGNLF